MNSWIKMVAYKLLSIIIFGIVLLSCSSPETNSEKKKSKETERIEGITENQEDKELLRLAKRKKMIEKHRLDSIRLEKVLSETLSKLKPNLFNSSFKDSFEVFPDSLYRVDISINYDYLFNKRQRHLFVRRSAPAYTQIDVFIHTEDGLKRILGHEQWGMEYTGDTLIDVNRDGYKDLVVNWYGLSGCCLKAHAEVYLMRPDLMSFSAATHFINPTFSPKERVIRGVCYGHPGETELYKFKWSGEQVDTIEYVAFEAGENGGRTGNVTISNQYPSHKDYKIIRKVNSVPKEYESIEGYSWFTAEFDRR